jgi:hypothetical protein
MKVLEIRWFEPARRRKRALRLLGHEFRNSLVPPFYSFPLLPAAL